jgi:putative RNA 2'-phosphotransferase
VRAVQGDLTSASKFLSFVLRHRPDAIGIELDSNGWVGLDELIAAAASHGETLSRDLIRQVVEQNDKKRFALSEDGERIRAVQGHSVSVDLQLEPTDPPRELFHGTATRFLASIRTEGLRSRSRQHVHLSADHETAVSVGSRHGKPVVLIVNASDMVAAGHKFYRSENGVWLTESVPAEFIVFP